MFPQNLSAAILGICDSMNLTYEEAAEKCGLSSRHFGSIARGQTSPTVITLEKLCIAFDRSPNELLGYRSSDAELSYRTPLQVMYFRRFEVASRRFTIFPVCPACADSIEREYQHFCSACGQKLLWDFYHHAVELPTG